MRAADTRPVRTPCCGPAGVVSQSKVSRMKWDVVVAANHDSLLQACLLSSPAIREAGQVMVQRGYDGTMPLLRHKPFRAVEVVVSLVLVTGMALVWSF